ncbi:MAG: ABC transporter ATP-binding protein [Clostridia bacterium]|nr:ABC transporter ATP-binding protein [Clostridia bacterium]
MKRVLSFLKPQAIRTSAQIVLKFLATLTELFLPWILEHIIDVIAPTGDKRQLALWGFLMLLCAGAAYIGAVTANRMAAGIAARFTRSLRHTLFDRVLHLESEQVDGFTVPSLISRISSDTYHVNDMVDRMLRLGIRAPILLIGGLLVSAMLEPALTLVLLCALPFLAGLLLLVSRKSIPLYAKAQEAGENLVRRIQENMTGVRIIKALSRTGEEKTRFAAVNRDVIRTEQKAEITMAIANPMMTVLLNIGMAVVIVVGASRVDRGLTEPGKIIAFLNYFTILLNGLIGITRIFTICSKGMASAKRIAAVLDAPDRVLAALPEDDVFKGHVVFDDVSFSYNKIRQNLSHISFSLERGQTLGVIGATGSGKSTLLQLLLRFYTPDEGRIYLDGKPLNAYSPVALHEKFGVVFQNDFLFADSIRENIDFARALDEDALSAALDVAQAGFVRDNLPQGMDTGLDERGMNLSGGQRQRLLIARALAANPEILLLDDCSSALDYRTDAALRKALAAAFADTTKIVIAQRISAIRHADQIMVLDDGNVIGLGTHDELMRCCETYRALCRIQMGEVA